MAEAPKGNSTSASAEQKLAHDLSVAVRKILDEDIRPYVQADGGDIELVGIEGKRVKVRLLGACGTCPSSIQTLRQGVEARLRAKAAPDLIVEETT